MRRRADLRRENVEHDLDDNDEQNVQKTLFCLPNVAMAKEKSGPGADNSHHATGRTNKLGWPHNLQQGEQDHPAGGSNSSNQVAHCKS